MRTFLLPLLLVATPAAADLVHLSAGGQIEGKVEQLDDGSYRVTTPSGTVVSLGRSQVSKVDEDSDDTRTYEGRARTTPDDAASQLKLAKWCREHQLNARAARHAKRVIELEPGNAEARQMLNFRNVDGEWMTREQVMESRGMVWYNGRPRTRQEIALMQRSEKQTKLAAHWSSEIRKWRRWLNDRRPERVQEAVANFSAVNDPMAGPPLVELMEDEKDPAALRLMAKAASQINHQSTVNALVLLSLNSPDEDLRLNCLGWLIDSKRPGLTEAYVKALRSNDNEVVNRAGVALSSLEDDSAIGPLIDALVTKHKKVVGGGGGGTTYSFTPSNGMSSFGGGGPKEISGMLKNPAVLGALVRITGEHFGYDQELWEKWHATQAQLVHVDLRRDK